jgi:hypothetical protein
MGTPADRELAIQAARAKTKDLMDILWLHDTTILDPEPPDPVREAYGEWRAGIDGLAALLTGTFARRSAESSEQYHMALTLRALLLALGLT